MLRTSKTKKISIVLIISWTILFSGCFGGNESYSGNPEESDEGDDPERSQPPWEEKASWDGELTCSFATPQQRGNLCTFLGVGGSTAHTFELDDDVETLVIGMDWQPSGQSTMEELKLILETQGSTRTLIDEVSGAPPVTLRLDKADGIDEHQDLQMVVYPAEGTGVVVDQPFTVHYHTFYLEPAEENYSPFP